MKRLYLVTACLAFALLLVWRALHPRTMRDLASESPTSTPDAKHLTLKTAPQLEQRLPQRTPTTNSTSDNSSSPLPEPKGPDSVDWKLDYSGTTFASFQPFRDGIRIAPYELRYEKKGDQWEMIEGVRPPSARVPPVFPELHDITQLNIDAQDAEKMAIREKLWWITQDAQYQPILKTEVHLKNQTKQYWFVDAHTGEVLKRTARSRH